MDEQPAYPTIAELERQHSIPPDRFCGLAPADMSRVVVACHSRRGPPGEPAGFWPIVSPEVQLDNLRAEFGPEADVARLRLLEQFFSSRVSRALAVDWQLADAEFDRAVEDGLLRHFPELTADARRAIAGGYSYSHMK
jgi:hypothetical protein